MHFLSIIMYRFFSSFFFLPVSSFCLLLGLTLAGFSGAIHAATTEVKQDKPLKIVTSIRPLALLAQELVGSEDEVIQLLTADRSPHHYQLTVSDRQKMEQAELIVWVGPELETFLQKPLGSYQGRLLTAAQLKGIN